MIYDILHERNCHFSLFLLFPIHAQGLKAVVIFDLYGNPLGSL